MRKAAILGIGAITLSAAARPEAGEGGGEVRVVVNGAAGPVDVTVGGQAFTSYRFDASLKKPVLYPLRTPRGTPVTRGFPLEPRPGERVDHLHHVGMWMNYGDVNGVDFWNNSDARSPEERRRMGTIIHRKVVRAAGGSGRGDLEVTADWLMPDGQPVLAERTAFVFR